MSKEKKNENMNNVTPASAGVDYNAETEERSIKKIVISYVITSAFALAFAFFIAYTSGVFTGTLAKRTLFGVISDAFFVPGGVFFGFGVLLKIADGGFFDSVSFILKRAFLSLIPGARIAKEDNYQEYKQKKEARRKHSTFSSVIIVGLVFIAIAAVFLVLYANA